jgi:spore coat protein CotH
MKTRMILAVSACLLFSSPVSADPLVDALFDKTRLHDVRITMAASDWATLRAKYQENTNYDATLTFDGETMADSTIRSRGSGTRNGIKPGLRVDFNRKVKSQTFHDFKTLVLDNMYNDASFVREQLAFSLFEQVGIVVPRESFARLTVNGEYWGVYAIIEPIDKIFVTTHVDGGQGNLWEYNVPIPIPIVPGQIQAWDFALSRGETIDAYVPSPFDPKTNEDTLDGTGLIAFLRTVSSAPSATFVHDIERFIDPHVLLTYFAVEVATGELDGLTSAFGPNNFYLYQLQGTDRFLIIPWDHDFNFMNPGQSIYYQVDHNRLLQRLIADPALNAFYRETLASIMSRYMNPEWMFPRIDAMVALIRDSVQADTKRQIGSDAATWFDDAVSRVKTVVTFRGTGVTAQLPRNDRRRAVGH